MYFTLSQEQSVVLIVFGGLLLVLLLITAYWSFQLHLARRKERETPETEYADGLRESNKPVPLFLILLIVVVLVWGIAYVIAVAFGGLHVQ